MDTLDFLDMCVSLQVSCRAKKNYKNRKNPFVEYTDQEFRIKYRFSKENARKIIKLVKADLKEKEKRKGGSIPPHIQVLAALRCWGRNQAQEDCAEYHGFTQSTMSRICQKVALAFAKKASTYIKMPTTAEEQIVEMEKFRAIAGFKSVVGAIDCTHIRIQAVNGDDAQLYVNRKGYFSFNVQVVSNASLSITDIVSCWRGSTHDSRIFNDSRIKSRFEDGAFMGRLIGDGGYKCTNYLFTPVQNPKDRKEEMYNKVHIKTRNVVERLFGCWKSRFRILLEKMRISRRNGKVLIVALAVLHNLAVMYKEDHFADEGNGGHVSGNVILQDNTEIENITRNMYIQQNF